MSDLGLSAVQIGWANEILAVVAEHQLTKRHGVIAIECALTESTLHMYANEFNPSSKDLPHDRVGHDHGSVGLFQQQVTGAKHSNAKWGTTAELMDVRISTGKFLAALLRVHDLDSVSNWRACQKVQNSAFDGADNYRVNDQLAHDIVDALWPGPVGQVIAPPPPAGQQTYTVKPGDTLAAIAGHFGTTWPHLAELNHLANPKLIHPGEKLIVPGGAAPVVAPADNHVDHADAQPVHSYTVRSGDTLFAIAARFGTTWQHLADLNHLPNPRVIRPGQLLTIG